MKEESSKNSIKPRKNHWKIFGPGITTGAADDDPSGIATYSQLGASRGFGLIWLSVFLYPLVGTIQEMCARIGLATGVGLAANVKRHFSRKVLYISSFLLLFANVFNIGADLGAMAESSKLLFPDASFALLVLGFAALSLGLQVFVPYKIYSKYLKYLSLVLVAYILSAIVIEIDWREALKSAVVPFIHFSKEEVILICAAFGTTISPYLFFWQTSQEVEESILEGQKTQKARRMGNTLERIKNMRIDVWSGMFISNLIMFFIIASTSAVLFGNGVNNIATASDAALALRPFAGEFSYLLFAVGIIGTGLLAIPVLAGSVSYAVSESLGWKSGLYRKFKQAGAFYGVIIAAVVLGIILNFIGLDPIKALIYSAVANGVISPIILFFILRLSGDEKIMGEFKNKPHTNVFGWFIFLLLALTSALSLFFIFW